jgi:hypothetical protein
MLYPKYPKNEAEALKYASVMTKKVNELIDKLPVSDILD